MLTKSLFLLTLFLPDYLYYLFDLYLGFELPPPPDHTQLSKYHEAGHTAPCATTVDGFPLLGLPGRADHNNDLLKAAKLFEVNQKTIESKNAGKRTFNCTVGLTGHVARFSF